MTSLHKIIDIINMGPIKWFLGMHISRNRTVHTISLSQGTYIDTILKKLDMTDSYGMSTLLDPNVVLLKSLSPTSDDEKAKMKDVPYLASFSSLMYAAMVTCPDITFVTNKLSQFSSNPGPMHWTALQCILQYLKRTRNYVLILGGKRLQHLSSYTNSGYAGCTDTQCSTSGYLFTLGQGSISWSSKQQVIMTTSMCEAEYVASCHAIKEAMWLQKLLELLGHKQPSLTIYSDNAGSIALTNNPTFHARSKNIDIQYHYTCK